MVKGNDWSESYDTVAVNSKLLREHVTRKMTISGSSQINVSILEAMPH